MSFLQIDHVTHTYFSLKEKQRPYSTSIWRSLKVNSSHLLVLAAAGKQPCFPSSQALRHPLKVEF